MATGMSPFGEVCRISRPESGAASIPLVFASAHSGDVHPPCPAAADQPARSLRSAEDALMQPLVGAGPAQGAVLLAAVVARSFVDLNRDPDELDPLAVEGAPAELLSPRARAGYGVIPRLSGDGLPLHRRRLTREEAQARLDGVHRPYHLALADLMHETRARHGRAILVDWHSMPGRAGDMDVVLGTRHGAACGSALSRQMQGLMERQGWRVSLNHPYAGGYSTRRWGRPDEGFEAVQVEINRRLYLDEDTLEPSPGYGALAKALSRIIAELCGSQR